MKITLQARLRPHSGSSARKHREKIAVPPRSHDRCAVGDQRPILSCVSRFVVHPSGPLYGHGARGRREERRAEADGGVPARRGHAPAAQRPAHRRRRHDGVAARGARAAACTGPATTSCRSACPSAGAPRRRRPPAALRRAAARLHRRARPAPRPHAGRRRLPLPGGDDFGTRPVNFHLEGLTAMGGGRARGARRHRGVRRRRRGGSAARGSRSSTRATPRRTTCSWRRSPPRARRSSTTRRASPRSRTSAAMLNDDGREDRGARHVAARDRGRRRAAARGPRGASPTASSPPRTSPLRRSPAGEVTVADARRDHMETLLRKLATIGVRGRPATSGSRPRVRRVRARATSPRCPYPGVATDYKPLLVAVLSVADGTSVVTENLFEGRFRYVEELARLGAQVSHRGPPRRDPGHRAAEGRVGARHRRPRRGRARARRPRRRRRDRASPTPRTSIAATRTSPARCAPSAPTWSARERGDSPRDRCSTPRARGSRRARQAAQRRRERRAGRARARRERRGRRRARSRSGVTGAPGAASRRSPTGCSPRRSCASCADGAPRRSARSASLCVDPTSPLSGGAILGDRIRMQDHALDARVFIRSLASRGHLGGLSVAVPDALAVLARGRASSSCSSRPSASARSSSRSPRRPTPTVVVVTPGWGDAMQAAKAGLLEVADVFVVNKADRPGADRGASATSTRCSTSASRAATTGGGRRSSTTVATEGTGTDELLDAIDAFRAHLAGARRRRASPRPRRARSCAASSRRGSRGRVDDVAASRRVRATAVDASRRASVDPYTRARRAARLVTPRS